MANIRLPLHICNSIKQYWLNNVTHCQDDRIGKKNKQRTKILNTQSNLKAKNTKKNKLILLLILLLAKYSHCNSYTGGRNSMLRTRVIGTRYGKLQGVILPMDQHKYLKPVEAYLGVPYATPPTGSNR